MQYFHRLASWRSGARPLAFRRLRLLAAASAAVALAMTLSGCETDDLVNARALRPLPPELAAEIDKRNMPRESPILIRIFKEEAELEVWKQDTSGRYALLKTYPICRWSGDLGPKVKLGDRQAPEGFYPITPAQMNPNSNYYLAFNLGFPNAFDKANDRTGDFLMVHGDCSSAGCYAMTDEQIQEIYALGRDAFLGGQKAFQVQAYPFRMTALNLARHRDNPNMPFWRMIKEGYDYFELTRAEPHVEVCEKHYVFNPRSPGNASAPPVFHPRDKCPAYEVAPEIAAALKAKEANDDRAIADLVHRGVSMAGDRTGIDGGMHPLFLAKLQGRTVSDPNPDVKVPDGPLPTYVVPPSRVPEDQRSLLSFMTPTWSTTPATTPPPAAATTTGETSTIGTIGRWLGLNGGDPPPAATTAPPPAAPPPKVRTRPPTVTANNKPKPDTRQGNRPTETAQVPPTPPPAVH